MTGKVKIELKLVFNKILMVMSLIVLSVVFSFAPAFSQDAAGGVLLAPETEASEGGGSEIKVETGDFKMVFSREGAALKSYRLNNSKFPDDFIIDSSYLKSSETVVRRPFTIDVHLASDSGSVLIDDSKMIYELKKEKIAFSEKLVFTAPLASSPLTIVKTYTIDHSQKLIKFSLKIKNNSTSSVMLTDGQNIGFAVNFLSNLGKNSRDDELISNFGGSLYKAIVSSQDYKHAFKTADSNITRWMAVRDSYYAAIVAFDDKKPVSASCAGIAGGELKDSSGFASVFKLEYPAVSIDEGESENYNYTLFMGVKTYDELKKFNKGFEDICEFNFLALLILQSLFFFYGITKSYGLSIILLTIAIKILLQPLTNKQTKSMKDMQKIQPYIAELKKKYPDNIQKQNEEVMKLYKEHGINPFSGCLPLLLQLPILFALFTALRSSVELKGEGFLWLSDLSLADPTWILPIAIALSMHIQQSQMQVDPNQAAAFQFMPIFMFFITYTLPAGVLLYWGVSNILQVGQQWYDRRKDSPAAGESNSIEMDAKTERVAGRKGGEKS